MNDYYKNVDTAAISNSDSNCTVAECENTDLAYYSADDTGNEHTQQGSNFAGLEPILKSLDQRLEAAVRVSDKMFAARSAGDLYRGLAITPADVAAALQREPGEPLYSLSAQLGSLLHSTQSLSLQRLQWLQQAYDLTEFDIDVIILALAPEIDLRYERLYAYLQDDVAKRKPGIDLALNLLCANANEKLRQRERFAPDAPLLHNRIIEVFANPHQLNSPLLARYFRLDEQVVRFLLLDDSTDTRLVSFCSIVNAKNYQNDLLLSEITRHQLLSIATCSKKSSIRLCFAGPAECGQKEAVALLAAILEMRVLVVDSSLIVESISKLGTDIFHSLEREVWWRGAVLYIKSSSSVDEEKEKQMRKALWRALCNTVIPFVIESNTPWVPSSGKPLGVMTLHFSTPAIAQREYWWRHCLKQNEVAVDDDVISVLAQRYRLNYAQIQDAAKTGLATHWAVEHDKDKSIMTGNHILSSSAKAQTRHLLARLALHIEPRRTWDDLVLPEDADTQLREICAQYINRQQVLDSWGFGQKLSNGKGINVLFAGPSGTGKTMAAEIIANELGLDLYKIDLAGVISKYIGETEKNLDAIFTAAEHANAVLFFDEADALFGKRTNISDAHDRYANIEVSYLLQKVEQYNGLAILATNLRDNMDEAFIRRLAFSVYFPFPDETQRLRIWRSIWPANTPLAEEVDLEFIAREIKVSGGSIKNIALSAAYLAAAQSSPIVMQYLIHAANREFDKLGRSLSIGQYHARSRVVTI